MGAWERLAAVIATGQMLRIGMDTTGVWQTLRRLTAPFRRMARSTTTTATATSTQQALADSARPLLFFQVVEHADTAVLVPRTEALRALKERLLE
jgi:hypothetical protein